MSRYFHHVAPQSGNVIFWRGMQTFAGVPVHINLNLLATAVGDVPPSDASLVPPVTYQIPGVGGIELQPFVEVIENAPVELPIGPNLKNILDYPLGNAEKLNLTLPFYKATLGMGDSGGGWFRDAETTGSFHGAWDITRAGDGELFEVCAAADGVVLNISKNWNAPIVIKHTAGESEFLTIYQHLDLSACPLNVNDPVKRGQFLARVADAGLNNDHFIHLHFMVAIKGPEFTHAGGQVIPAQWYAIDPFGVYDYYKNTTDPAIYNYVPDVRPDCFTHRIQGASNIVQWAAQPLIKALPVVNETAYLKIIHIQLQGRELSSAQGLPPAQQNRCFIWLEGINQSFFVPFDPPSGDNMIELKMIDFLMQCFDRQQPVKLRYYPVGEMNFIAAVLSYNG